jgi:hypothetical protein
VAEAARWSRVCGELRRFANPVQSAGEARLTGPLSRPTGGRDDVVVAAQVDAGVPRRVDAPVDAAAPTQSDAGVPTQVDAGASTQVDVAAPTRVENGSDGRGGAPRRPAAGDPGRRP